MKPFLNPDDPFFAKPWRRWAATLGPLGWGLVEFWMSQPFWGVLFVAAGAYAGKVLILNRPSDK